MKKIYFFALILLISNNYLKAQRIVGVDVSHHQGTINWTQVSNSGRTFAYVKATEGRTVSDNMFRENMNKGKAAGVVMGAYHFARPVNNSARDEVNSFLRQASPYIGKGFLPPALDVEANASDIGWTNLCKWIQEWMTLVTERTGVTPIIYINTDHSRHLCSYLNSYKLWIANYNIGMNGTPPIGVWNDYLIFQHSEKGSVPGISGNADLDIFHSSLNNFNNLIGNTSSSAPSDMVIENMFTSPASPKVGQNVDLYVTIKNVGSGTAENIKLKYYVDNKYVGYDTHPSLAYNTQTSEFFDNYVFNTSGTHKYCVYIDAIANEKSTTNNSYCKNINVGSMSYYRTGLDTEDKAANSLAVNDFDWQEQLKVYPNPTSNAIFIESGNGLVVKEMSVYDINGRFIKKAEGKSINTIDLSELSNGLYILKVLGDDDQEATFRIIKK